MVTLYNVLPSSIHIFREFAKYSDIRYLSRDYTFLSEVSFEDFIVSNFLEIQKPTPLDLPLVTNHPVKPTQYVFIMNKGKNPESDIDLKIMEDTIGYITHLIIYQRSRDGIFLPVKIYEVNPKIWISVKKFMSYQTFSFKETFNC